MAAGDQVTAQWHLEWRGLLLGWPLTSITISDLKGWLAKPPSRSANMDRPGRHGQFPGLLRSSGRVVEVEFTPVRTDPATFTAFTDALTLAEDPQEEPLVIWAGTDTPQLIYARAERCDIPTDQVWSVGYWRAVAQWVATDPRRYSLTLHSQSVGLPTVASGGLVWPLVWPLDWGPALGGGRMTVTNTGNAATWPVFTITGPCTGPVITNTGSGERLAFDPAFTIAAGQTLTVDTDARTVDLVGVSRRDRLFTSQWFPLLPDVATSIAFSAVSAYDPAAALSVAWRDAWT